MDSHYSSLAFCIKISSKFKFPLTFCPMEQNTGFSLLKNLELVYMVLSSRVFFTNYSLTVSFSKFSFSPYIFLSVRVLKGLFRGPNLGSSFYTSIWPPETGHSTPSKTIQIMTLLWSQKMRFLSLSLSLNIEML